MSINPVFCNIYLWFNLSAVSFFLCVFVFHSVLLLVNSTLVIFVVPYEYSFCLLVKEINLLGWFSFAMHHQSFPWFASWLFSFFLFPFFPFLLSFTCPLLSFSKLLATSQKFSKKSWERTKSFLSPPRTQTKKGTKEKESFKFKSFQVFYDSSGHTDPHLGGVGLQFLGKGKRYVVGFETIPLGSNNISEFTGCLKGGQILLKKGEGWRLPKEIQNFIFKWIFKTPKYWHNKLCSSANSLQNFEAFGTSLMIAPMDKNSLKLTEKRAVKNCS